MAKSLKKSKEATAQDRATGPGMESSNSLEAKDPAKPGTRKAAKSPRRAKSDGLNRKASPGRKTRPKSAPKRTTATGAKITDDEIRIRAYLISEWRAQNGVVGDSARDWLEALRQLQEESEKRG